MTDEKVKEVEVEQPMRTQLLNLVEGMQKDGFSFIDKHPVFTWKYEEMPNIVFSLQIKEVIEEEPKLPDGVSAIVVPSQEIVT